MDKKETQEPYIVDDQKWISRWLQEANRQEYEEGVSEIGDAAIIDPSTPPRRAPLVMCYEEVSPTNTSFSDGSIFDIPTSASGSWIVEDPFYNNSLDIAPVGLQELDKKDKAEQRDTRLIQAHPETDSFDNESLASYDPPTEAADDLEELFEIPDNTLRTKVPRPVHPDQPLTWVTSCTQCIHADLPCSRTPPSCSRCRRNGQAALCLLHRRMFPEEIYRSDASSSRAPVLLRLKGESETVWKAKLSLAEELREVWHAEEERKNWALPSVESPRGTFRDNGTRVQRLYPGEGKGEKKEEYRYYQELHVAIDE